MLKNIVKLIWFNKIGVEKLPNNEISIFFIVSCALN